ncbi:histidine phosphatase family protein [Streptomyces sp. NPDC001933]|uniref:histidine phosphatase family protein n=1 Tax=Streptomyces sp. NPDC001933 TaxID=3364626 RepID=UPI003676BABC
MWTWYPHTQSVAREGWTGDESARPLSPQGLSQAGSLAAVMRDSIDAIHSSPAKRCVQTVEPLARSWALPRWLTSRSALWPSRTTAAAEASPPPSSPGP